MNKLAYSILIICLMVAWAATLSAVDTPAVTPLVRVAGNHFVDANGKGIVFRGLGFPDPLRLQKAGQWSDAYFKEAASWGANVVRIPVHPNRWHELGTKNYLALLDQGVQLAKKNGLLVMIDWHVIGNLKTELFQNPDEYDTTMKETLTFWRTVASHFKNEPTVAFYEVFNEPTTINGELGGLTWAEWKVIAETLINLVRANDPKAIPLVGGLDWAYDLTPVKDDPINIPGIGYTVHPYPQKRKQPWPPQWEKDFGFVADRYPVFCTEFGFGRNANMPAIGTPDYGQQILDYFQKKGISWTVWCFDPDWDPALLTDWQFKPNESGEFFKNAMQKAKAANQ